MAVWLLSITKGCISLTFLLDYTLAGLIMYAHDLLDLLLLLYGVCTQVMVLLDTLLCLDYSTPACLPAAASQDPLPAMLFPARSALVDPTYMLDRNVSGTARIFKAGQVLLGCALEADSHHPSQAGQPVLVHECLSQTPQRRVTALICANAQLDEIW